MGTIGYLAFLRTVKILAGPHDSMGILIDFALDF